MTQVDLVDRTIVVVNHNVTNYYGMHTVPFFRVFRCDGTDGWRSSQQVGGSD